MKTIGITASIKNNQLVVDRSIIDTVVQPARRARRPRTAQFRHPLTRERNGNKDT